MSDRYIFQQTDLQPSDTEQHALANAIENEDMDKIESSIIATNQIDRLLNFKGQLIYPLHLACQIGNDAVAHRLIEASADVNLQDHDGCSPLYIASRNGHYQVVITLINADADVNLQEIDGCSPLYIASQNGHHQVVDLLIQTDADVNLQGIDEYSPVYIASQEGHNRVVTLLIKAQADVNLQEIDGCSPLYIASQNGHSAVVDLLIEAQADVDLQRNTGESPILIASHFGHQKVVESLIKANADINLQRQSGLSALYIATQEGHYQVVESLVNASADVNLQIKTGESPLIIASQNGQNLMVRILIQAQADVNLQSNNGESPLFLASYQGHHRIVNSLIGAQADVNIQDTDGCSSLYIASQNGHHKVVASLIRAQADVDLQEVDGCSPLYIASQNGHHQVVDSLIKAQADVNLQRNTHGSSPLYIASKEGHHQLAKLLIKAQADVNLQKYSGESPLYIASKEGHHQLVKSLIKAQAGINLQNIYGYSALYVASMKGHHQVVDELIKAQADQNMKDNSGKSPLVIAFKNCHHQVVDLLLRASADMSLQEASSCYDASQDTQDGYYQATHASLPQNSRISLTETQLSQKLHSSLSRSGFVDVRAALQSAVADVLQTIQRQRMRSDDQELFFIVGSYSEGWGNSLVTLDGRTDHESDIDLMHLLRGRLFHLRGHCDCIGVTAQPVEYSNGHIFCHGFASNPAVPVHGSTLRPAVDKVSACRLCSYPPIGPLIMDRAARSNIPSPVLQLLKHELTRFPCHVVHAAPSGQAGEQLRVSTTFLEKRLLRSLTTLQGQLFVVLKYLVKKVICRRVQGLKAYHVKTIAFRMLEEKPAEEWKVENLMNLTRQSLQMLLDSVESSCSSVNGDGSIMNHFFLGDAALYLKAASCCDVQAIAETLRVVIDQLPQLLIEFEASLKPVNDSDTFYFHPFLILPLLQANTPVSRSSALKYHEIYDVVRESLLRLSEKDCSCQEKDKFLTGMVDCLPDCARSAREALRALTCLKFGDRDAAAEVLNACREHTVSRGIPWSPDRSKAEATEELVWQHLRTSDSAWKFCFEFDKPPMLTFLPPFLTLCFPLAMLNQNNYFYMNFGALLRCLSIELTTIDASTWGWIQEVADAEDADVQEVAAAMVAANKVGDEEILLKLRMKLDKLWSQTAK